MDIWKSFELKHSDNKQKAFEDLTYHLFCYEFNHGRGIHRYKNQKAIETDPINYNGDCIGFQTKFYDELVSKKKKELINCIDKAKKTYPNLTRIVFYIYNEYTQSSKKNQSKPDYIQEIEEYGYELGIGVIWRVRSQLEKMLLEPENILIYYLFFDTDFTGIQSINSFIRKSENLYRPNLMNTYSKIDDIHDVLLKNIEENKLICISGNQGIGKSRLSIEIAKDLNDDYNVFIVDIPDLHLISNLKKIIRCDKKYLIIFDNYNTDFNGLKYIIGELWNYCEENNIKFLITLKKQHYMDLKEELSDFIIFHFDLDIVNDNEMRKIIKSSLDDDIIIKQSAIQKIIKISKGNIGVCMMVLSLFNNDNINSLNNYHDIYKHYFESTRLNRLNTKTKRLLGLISFFEKIDLENEELLTRIYNAFNINLIDEIDSLHIFFKEEVLDLNNNTIYFSDSILSTYFFFLTFIDEKILSLKDLIIHFISSEFNQLNSRIYDIIMIFGIDFFNKLKNTQLNHAFYLLNEKNQVNFYIIFHSIYVDEITIFLQNWIESIESSNFDINEFKSLTTSKHIIKKSELTLLSRLFYSENQIIGLRLVISLIIKKQSFTPAILYALKKEYSYSIFNIENNFSMQNKLMDFIESNDFNEMEQNVVDYIFLFLLDQNRFFSLIHTQILPTSNLLETELFEITMPISKAFMDLRIRFLEKLFDLYQNYSREVLNNFEKYVQYISQNFVPIYKNEEQIIYNFLKTLNYEYYKPNKVCYLYLRKMKEKSIDLVNTFDFMNEDIINNILLCSNVLDHFLEGSFEEKIDSFKEYLSNNELIVKPLFDLMNEIKNNEDNYRLFCDELFCALIQLNLNKFKETFWYYMENNLNFLKSYYFVKLLVNHENNNLEIFSLINTYDYENKIDMNYFYYKFVSERYITTGLLNSFISFIKNNPNSIDFFKIDNYLKFESVFQQKKDIHKNNSSNIIQFIIQTVIENFDDVEKIIIYDFCKNNYCYFEDNLELLETFYLKCILLDNSDYDFSELRFLCEKDKYFLFRYFEYRLDNNDDFYRDNSKIDFIWDFDYTFEEIDSLINLILDKYYFDSDPINLLFSGKIHREKEFISYAISSRVNDNKFIRAIFEVIKFNYSQKEYIVYLKEFLMINDDYEIFKLIMEPYFLRILYNKIAFLKDQIIFFKEIKTMLMEIENPQNYLQHKIYITNKIEENEEKLRKISF